MKFGIMFANTGNFTQAEHAIELAQTAEEAGIESLWTVEHVVVPKHYDSVYPYNRKGKLPGDFENDIPDPVVWMSFVAAVTKTIRLSTGILILPQRHPLYVAKEFATLDQLSGGRAMMGIGIGWLREEFDALGIDFSERVQRSEESMQALRSLWRDDSSSFEGARYAWQDVGSFPKPAQPEGVPIIVGGHVPAAARRAARFGDGFFPGRIDRLDELLAALREECAKIGRDPAEIELTTGTPDMNLDGIKQMQDKGIERLVMPPPGNSKDDIRRGVEQFAENIIHKL
ncbi:MAG: LLM class F420-dependent oxidoreductase [Pseudomonadota bacterium]